MKLESLENVVLLPRLCVQNANAVSSPLTWGFPAPSAFTGFVHALQRRLSVLGHDLRLPGVGIVCHRFEPQVSGRYAKTFCLTRNPVDKDGSTAAIVEEGRAHLEVSLVIAISGEGFSVNSAEQQSLATEILTIAQGMRLAGGSVLPHPERDKYPARWIVWPGDWENQTKTFRKLRRQLLPGFALVSREALLVRHMESLCNSAASTKVDALDALLDLCRLNIDPVANEETGETDWTVRRPYRGWLVPLPIGYGAISPLYPAGEVKNARDDSVPFRFVESVLSLGEWVSPHRVPELEQLFWRHDAQPDAGLYRLRNSYSPIEVTTTLATEISHG